MKKSLFVTALVAVLALSLVLVGCASNQQQTAQEPAQKSTIESVLAKKELVVGTAPGYFPFEMTDKQGNIIGFDIDVAKKIADVLGVNLKIERFAFDGLIPALQTGKIDMIIAGMTITGGRALSVSFSNPYYVTGQVLMVTKSNPGITSWKQLDVKGKSIGVSIGTTGALLAKEIFKNAEIKEYDTLPDAALAATTGKVDGVVYDEPGIRVCVAQQPDSLYGVWELMSDENLGIAVKKDDYSTIQWLNSFLLSYVDGVEYKAAVAKWFDNMDWLDDVTAE